ncbi:MAG: hypothetical protein ABJA35_04355 [Parafilimonas sp.]
MPRPIDNNALQGKWVLTETKSANVGTDKPLNEEVITFSLPNHYLTSRNGLWLNEGEYSFSTNIVNCKRRGNEKCNHIFSGTLFKYF